MSKKYVCVESETDSLGIVTPLKIKWDKSKGFTIERVIHISRENSELIEYVVLIHGQQKKLFKEKDRWFVNANY